MLKSFVQLDKILRGDATQLSSLEQGKIEIASTGLSVVLLLLGMLYGLCAGSYAMIQSGGQNYMQLIASTVKIPLLFFLTLVVTFPSLYVFNALIGSRLSIISSLRLLIASAGVMLAVLASLGPIVVFFALSTTNYPFMILLNVATGTVSGLLGLGFLLRTLHRLVIIQEGLEVRLSLPKQDPVTDKDAPQTKLSALDQVGRFTSRKAKNVFRIWTVVFALVGAQMSWVLRPFIGSPTMPFTWFRQQEGNFFIAVFKAFIALFS